MPGGLQTSARLPVVSPEAAALSTPPRPHTSMDAALSPSGVGTTAAASAPPTQQASLKSARLAVGPPRNGSLPLLKACSRDLSNTWSHARLWCAIISTHWTFESFMILVIFWSCCMLTLDSNSLAECAAKGGRTSLGDSCSWRIRFLSISDSVVLAIFLLGESLLFVYTVLSAYF